MSNGCEVPDSTASTRSGLPKCLTENLAHHFDMQTAIPFMQLRGGSSKGLYFKASDLPADPALRQQVLLAAMAGVGPGDKRQIDGLGGGDALTSKVAIVATSQRAGADLDYEFIQVVVGGNTTDDTQNCGNILAGVVPFAIEAGLLQAAEGETRARVFMTNSDSICEVIVQTRQGRVEYTGAARIDGVPGTAAPVICHYHDTAGSACGALLPTGHLADVIDGIRVTCIDNGMPVVLLRAVDLECTGYETPEQLNANVQLKQRLESIRLQAGPLMKLGEVGSKVVPKMSLLAPPRAGGVVHSRTFIPHVCHAAIGVLGAVSVATACVLPGTVAEGIAVLPTDSTIYSVEHASGELSVTLEIDFRGSNPEVRSAGLLRTARLLSRGEVLIPAGIWDNSSVK
jgi:4-oxalomesaconate tautomerase